MDLWIAHNVEQVHFTKTRLTIYHKNNKIIIFTPYGTPTLREQMHSRRKLVTNTNQLSRSRIILILDAHVYCGTGTVTTELCDLKTLIKGIRSKEDC